MEQATGVRVADRPTVGLPSDHVLVDGTASGDLVGMLRRWVDRAQGPVYGGVHS